MVNSAFPWFGLIGTEDQLGLVLAQEDTTHGTIPPSQLQGTWAIFYSL